MPKFNVVQPATKVDEIMAVSQNAANHAVKVGIRKGSYDEDAYAQEVVEDMTSVFDAAALEINATVAWMRD
jgi:hypothetical protein